MTHTHHLDHIEENYRGRVALITGASRGIGRAITLALADLGVQVACLARSLNDLSHTVNACSALGGTAIAVAADLTDRDQIERAVEEVNERLGPIDILINNAGISARGAIQSIDLLRVERAMAINLMAAIRLTSLVAPGMCERGSGAVINISSIVGKLTAGGASGYIASKHGLVGFSGSVFEDLREHGIKVSVICPGFVNTEMAEESSLDLDPEKMIQPDDVADAVLFILGCGNNICPTEIVLRPQRNPTLHKGSDYAS